MTDFSRLISERMLQARPSFQAPGSPRVLMPPTVSRKQGYGQLGQALGGPLGVALGRFIQRKTGIGESREQVYQRALKAADVAQHMSPEELTQAALDDPTLRKEYLKFHEVAPSRFTLVPKGPDGKPYAYPRRKYVTPEIEREMKTTKDLAEGKETLETRSKEADIERTEQETKTSRAREEALRQETSLARKLEETEVKLKRLGLVKEAEEINALRRSIEESAERSSREEALLPSRIEKQTAETRVLRGQAVKLEEAWDLQIADANLKHKDQVERNKLWHDTWDSEAKALRANYSNMGEGQPGFALKLMEMTQSHTEPKDLAPVEIPVREGVTVAVSGAIVDQGVRSKINIALGKAYQTFLTADKENKNKIFKQYYDLFMQTYGTLLDEDGSYKSKELEGLMSKREMRHIVDMKEELYELNVPFYWRGTPEAYYKKQAEGD